MSQAIYLRVIYNLQERSTVGLHTLYTSDPQWITHVDYGISPNQPVPRPRQEEGTQGNAPAYDVQRF